MGLEWIDVRRGKVTLYLTQQWDTKDGWLFSISSGIRCRKRLMWIYKLSSKMPKQYFLAFASACKCRNGMNYIVYRDASLPIPNSH